jgi:hypothetical protein
MPAVLYTVETTIKVAGIITDVLPGHNAPTALYRLSLVALVRTHPEDVNTFRLARLTGGGAKRPLEKPMKEHPVWLDDRS